MSPLVRKLERWQKLDDAERAALLALPHVVQKVEAGRYIVREGDKPSHACMLVSGFAFRQKLTGDGARSISAVHMAGDAVDLQNALLGTSDHSVQTLTQAEVAFIPRGAVIDLAIAHPKVGLAMWHDTLVDGSIFREWVLNVSRRDAPTRIAHVLCELAMRLESAGLGDRYRYELPMTQEQLADATGLTSVHVNRTLKYLQAEGLISRTIRSVAIADWERLERAADFNSTYLHLRDEESLLP